MRQRAEAAREGGGSEEVSRRRARTATGSGGLLAARNVVTGFDVRATIFSDGDS
jgi:hypothetical protein